MEWRDLCHGKPLHALADLTTIRYGVVCAGMKARAPAKKCRNQDKIITLTHPDMTLDVCHDLKLQETNKQILMVNFRDNVDILT